MSNFDHTARIDLPPEVRAYLRDWLAWVHCGAPDGRPYSRVWGLCSNTSEYPADPATLVIVNEGLCDAFPEEDAYPFGRDAYTVAVNDRTQHLDPRRLEWVRVNAPDDDVEVEQ